ncbi:MAG TPA: multidrug effflux MFS transporter [Methylomirabilota bacterium]|nr:multidrug effflux MFS transporter [Methylomirabilota bacterium]
MTASSASTASSGAGPSFREFVAIIALLMALTAMSIDILLPAFPMIARDFQVADGNNLQYLVYIYMFGFAAMQLVYGPISDALGRRPVMMVGVAIYLVGCALAYVAPSFETLALARAIQGMGAASARVLTVSIVRDRFGGRDMAQVMSFVMMIFIMVPIVAPALGGLLIAIGDWHMVFAVMFLIGVLALVWYGVRMPETMHPEFRLPLSPGRIAAAAGFCLRQRVTIGYANAMGLLLGCLMGYIGSAQQIFEGEVYGLGVWFPLAFGLLALAIGLGSFINARLVQTVGMRRLTHAALIAAAVAAGSLAIVSIVYGGKPPLLVFGGLLGVFNLAFALAMPNCNALSMQPLGAVAGTASSLIGFYTTLMGTLLGLSVGLSFDGTVTPLAVGFFAICVAALIVVAITEGGRLFQANPPGGASERKA